MLNAFLQVLLDPRVTFGLGILFFGAIVAAAELSQHLERKKKPPPDPDDIS